MVDPAALLNIFIAKNPARSAQRGFGSGGQHSWSQNKKHHFASGRGLAGNHWECKNPNCRYHDQACLYNTIASFPGCCHQCDNCGDWGYNCRETCPNSSQTANQGSSEPIYRYHCEQENGWRFFYSNRSDVQSGWTYDGVAFRVPLHGANGVSPVYQYHYDQSNTYGGWRFNFTTSPHCENEGWTMDEIAFFGFNSAAPGTIPIYEHRAMQSDGARFLLTGKEHC